MATYNLKQLLNDYAHGRITPEMAMGHSLQHIDLLYEAQASATAERSALRLELNQLQAAFHQLQQAVEGQISAGTAPVAPRRPKLDQTAVRSSFGQPNLANEIVCHSPLVCSGLSAIIDWTADCTKSGWLGIIKADHCLSNKDHGHQLINCE